ncbi:hypothetical protein Tco_0727937 [Tanacetum coccineum]|uniref:Tf2-1-like SH3-like domain-containing protein n=1 Tax=Tanacetum coccineum TaxID=301880 RepID=A0ABQ4YKU4_9ASTR
MTDKVVLIKEKLKAARDRQKSYADNRRKPLEFEVGDRVMLKVSPWKGVIRFGKKGKLALRYVGPFEILERIGPVAYRLRLPKELSGVHDTFHVSNLKKCLADASLHVPLDEIKVDKTLRFVEEPVEIMDREVKSLKRSRILLVKVHWNSKRGPEFTWEREDHMKSKYPQLFVDRAVESARHVSIMRMLRLKEVARKTVGMHLKFAPDDSLLLTPLCYDDIHDVTPHVSALAGCDRLVSERGYREILRVLSGTYFEQPPSHNDSYRLVGASTAAGQVGIRGFQYKTISLYGSAGHRSRSLHIRFQATLRNALRIVLNNHRVVKTSQATGLACVVPFQRTGISNEDTDILSSTAYAFLALTMHHRFYGLMNRVATTVLGRFVIVFIGRHSGTLNKVGKRNISSFEVSVGVTELRMSKLAHLLSIQRFQDVKNAGERLGDAIGFELLVSILNAELWTIVKYDLDFGRLRTPPTKSNHTIMLYEGNVWAPIYGKYWESSLTRLGVSTRKRSDRLCGKIKPKWRSRLRLSEELNSVHHVSNVKKCLADASLHVSLDEIKVDKTLLFIEEPVEIMEREIKKLKRRNIALGMQMELKRG